jgi:hypothetical protein
MNMEHGYQKKYCINKSISTKALSILFQALDVFGINESDLKSRCREINHVLARTAIIKILRDHQKLPFKTIGKILNRDYSAIIRRYKKHDEWYCTNHNAYKWQFQDFWDRYIGANSDLEVSKSSSEQINRQGDYEPLQRHPQKVVCNGKSNQASSNF